MLISNTDFRLYVPCDWTDEMLEEKLKALEIAIRKYTNNNFQARSIRSRCTCTGSVIVGVHPLVLPGDTVEISDSKYNGGIYTVDTVEEDVATVNEFLNPEDSFLLTKVQYPRDIVMGAVNLLNWDINHRDKVGIQSETISRHSVTYFNMDGDNSLLGYPTALTGFLEPYRKARF